MARRRNGRHYPKVINGTMATTSLETNIHGRFMLTVATT